MSLPPLLLLLAVGCPGQSQTSPAEGPSPDPEPMPAEPDPLVTLNTYADEMCACQDDPCRSGVDAKMTAYAEANRAEVEALGPATLAPIGERYTSCQRSEANGKLIAEFAALTDKMCGCQDKACAEAVNTDFNAWMNANVDSKGSKEQQEEAKAIAGRYTKCMMTVMTPAAAPAMGEKCGEGDACAAGLECVKYYGIAGKRGGEFTSCEQRCGKGKPACGEGHKCTTIADGPGQVCRP